MKKIKKVDVKKAQSVLTFASCMCGRCSCSNCNNMFSSPREAEIGNGAIRAMRSGGYFK